MVPVIGKSSPDGKSALHHVFHEIKGELFIVLGPDSNFKTAPINKEDWDQNTRSAVVFKLKLKAGKTAKEVKTIDNAHKLLEEAHSAFHMDRETMCSEISYGGVNMVRIFNTPQRHKNFLYVSELLNASESDFLSFTRVPSLPSTEPA